MQESYREIFLSESQEYLKSIGTCLVRLEANPGDLDSLNEIFRYAHTLKGMSATMGYDAIAKLTHQMEDLLDELRGKRKAVTTEIIDALFACLDILERLLQDVALKQDSKIDIASCLQLLKDFLTEEPHPAKPHPTKEKPKAAAVETKELTGADLIRLKEAREKGLSAFRIKIVISPNCLMKEARAFLILTHLKRLGEILHATPSLEDLHTGHFGNSFTVILASKERQEALHKGLLNVAEIEDIDIAVIDYASQPAQCGAGAAPEISYIKKIQSMRIPVQRLDRIMDLTGELTIAKIQLMQIVQSHKSKDVEEISIALDRLTSTLQDEIMQTRLLPASYILDAFSRVVRDLAKGRHKEVGFEISGGDIELDRIVLDEIGDPLIHLIRNAIDHGIETPEERIAKGKNPKGKISIIVSRQKGQIYIEVIDDGKGIDIEAVRRTALEKGLLSEAEATNLDEKRVFDLIVMPGFSTAKEITDVSGRGVGLDVVKIKIESLGGRLDFENRPNQGSRFLLTLPLTLAIIKAMLVRVQQEMLAIPLMNIRETIKVAPGEIKVVQNLQVVKVRNEIIPILRMDKELGIPGWKDSAATAYNEKTRDDEIPLVIIEYERKAVGLLVSEVVGEQDIVVKPLPAFVKKTKGIAGATILGDGRVALILDIMSLR
jgi:two-component system chemotaxis sensor kinase CheA